MMLDIDYFKQYNDHYGHPQGDVCLQQVAKILRDNIYRSEDIVARYGGEEFLLLFDVSSENKMNYFMQSNRIGFENLKIEHVGSQIADHLTVSIDGVFISSGFWGLGLNLARLQADHELYKVKNNSRNAVSVVSLDKSMLVGFQQQVAARHDRRYRQ